MEIQIILAMNIFHIIYLGNFRPSDIIVILLVSISYIIIFYLIIKQLYRNFSFGKTLIPIKNKQLYKKYPKAGIFINVALSIIYLIVIYRDINSDIALSIMHGYYDTYLQAIPIKISLSLLPLFIVFLIHVCGLSRKRITIKGIVGDKFAFTWKEIQNIEKNNENLKIYYKYKILFIDIKLLYTIDERDIIDKAYKIINNQLRFEEIS